MSNEPSQFRIDVANAIGTTPKNNDKITDGIKRAKAALNISTSTRHLTDDHKFLIIQWLSNNSEQQTDIETIAPPVAIKTAPTLIEQLAISREAALNEPPALSREDAIGLVDYLKAKLPSVSILALKHDADLDLRMVEKLLSRETKNNTEYSNCLQKILELFPDLSPPVINEPIETTRTPLHIDTTIIPVRINNVNIEPAAIIEQVETVLSETDIAAINQAQEFINAPLSELELLRIENAKLQARLEAVEHKAAPTYDEQETVRISFYALGKRQGIWLKGYFVNSLILAAGIDKKGVPAWLGGRSFDANDKNITEQVKLLIVRELEEQLIKARDVIK